MKILVTGCAGFIGFHLTQDLLEKSNYEIVGIDNLNSYYDVKLKKLRLQVLKNYKSNFKFKKIDLNNNKSLEKLFKSCKFDYVVHLAAQAGVRYSITNPDAYIDSNISGFFNIINFSKQFKIKHFIFASTSSVYGVAKNFPVNEESNSDKPLTLYAATKKTNEVIAHSFANIYKLPSTALRFFTVYGPFGRPDMAFFKFADSISKNKRIDLYNNGKHYRDFTYVKDITASIIKLIKKQPNKNIPFSIFNIGNGESIYLKDAIKIIEKKLGKKALIKNLPLQKGDVIKSHSDINKLKKFINYKPKTNIKKGLDKFIEWYKVTYLNG